VPRVLQWVESGLSANVSFVLQTHTAWSFDRSTGVHSSGSMSLRNTERHGAPASTELWLENRNSNRPDHTKFSPGSLHSEGQSDASKTK
jgi:hypothetical protein